MHQPVQVQGFSLCLFRFDQREEVMLPLRTLQETTGMRRRLEFSF